MLLLITDYLNILKQIDIAVIYSLTTVPVPTDAKTYLWNSKDYPLIALTCKNMVIVSEYYISLSAAANTMQQHG